MKSNYRKTVGVAVIAAGWVAAGARAVDSPGNAPSPHNTRKNRYVSFVPNNAGASVAFLVELAQSTLFGNAVGLTAWVGEPFDPGCPDPGDPPENCAGELVSRLECVPVFRVWDDAAYVHVRSPYVIPRSTYRIFAIAQAGGQAGPLTVDTSPKPLDRQWADAVGIFQIGTGWGGPDGFVNVNDLQAGINTMQDTPSSAPTTWIDLSPDEANYIINISDIQAILQGIAGWAYPFPNPNDVALPGPPGCGDCNGNDICDICDVLVHGHPDCDGDLVPDVCETDCDLNGIPDDCTPPEDDCDGDLIPDACEGDCDGDGIPDDCESSPREGDCNFNGTCDGEELDNCGGLVPCLDCNGNEILDECEPDADGDGLPDDCEADAAIYGTNPDNPDSDGDGLTDPEEIFGTLDGAPGGLDLPALGADPNHKNLFLEIDWFDDGLDAPHSHRPTPAAIQMVVDAFAAAPLMNPDGTTGIDLIVDYGQGGLFTGGNNLAGGDTVITWPAEFQAYKAANFAANRQGYFRYSIHAHWYNAPNSGSGFAEIGGDDFVVTLGSALGDSNVSKTIMHEFGHNLSLRHGGFEDRNYKPNYNSVMSYRFQFAGIDDDCDSFGDGVLDYSYGVLSDLDETALDESAGVCGPGFPVDWNLDFSITAPVARNINCVEGETAPCGSNPGLCYDSTCGLLSDYADWANLQLAIPALNRAPSEVVECTNTPPPAPRSTGVVD